MLLYGFKNTINESKPFESKHIFFEDVTNPQLMRPMFTQMLNYRKTLETFFVSKVSYLHLRLNYERKNLRKGDRFIFEPRIQKCYYG